LVREEIVRQEAEKRSIGVSDSAMDSRIAKLKAASGRDGLQRRPAAQWVHQ